jgi:hypothetical protein
MRTFSHAKQFACTTCLAAVALCTFPNSTPAQSLGECTDQVISAPTENSVRVRLTGVNDWPVNPICSWSASGLQADGNYYSWMATLIGDGLVENPTYVNAAVIFHHEVRSASGLVLSSRRLVFNTFSPYPSDGFNLVVISDPDFRTPAEGEGGTWYGEVGNIEDFPALSFEGTINLDAAGNFTVDITFTGGTPPPAINDLVSLLNRSSLSQRQQRPLLATLEAAADSLARGDCETAINQLQTFQNKVRAQVGGADASLADTLIATAQAIIDSGCGE